MVGRLSHLISIGHQSHGQNSLIEGSVIDEKMTHIDKNINQVKNQLPCQNKKVVSVSNKKVQTICNSAALKAIGHNYPYQDYKSNILRIVINSSGKEFKNYSCTPELSIDREDYSASCQDTLCETFDSSNGLLEASLEGKFKNSIKDNNSYDDGFENIYKEESSGDTFTTLTKDTEKITTVSRETKNEGFVQRRYRLCSHKGKPHEISNNAVTVSSGSVNNRRHTRKIELESVKKRIPKDFDLNSSPNSSDILSGTSDSVDGELFYNYPDPVHSPWGPPHKHYPYLYDVLNIANMQHDPHLNINRDLLKPVMSLPRGLNNVEHLDTCLIPTHALRNGYQYHTPQLSSCSRPLSEDEKSKLNIDPNTPSCPCLAKNSKEDGHEDNHESNFASSSHLIKNKEICQNSHATESFPPIISQHGKGDDSLCQFQNQCHPPYYTVPAQYSQFCPLPLPLHDFLRNPAYHFLPATNPPQHYFSQTNNTKGMQNAHPLISNVQPLSAFQGYSKDFFPMSRENVQNRPTAQPIIQQNDNDNSHLVSSISEDESRSKTAVVRRRPFIICYICGREFGTASIEIHEKQCLDKWRKVNSQLPKKEQRKEPVKPVLDVSLALDGRMGPTEEDLAIFNEVARETFQQQYLKCEKCGRTFIPESLKRHVQGCRGFRNIVKINNDDTSLTF